MSLVTFHLNVENVQFSFGFIHTPTFIPTVMLLTECSHSTLELCCFVAADMCLTTAANICFVGVSSHHLHLLHKPKLLSLVLE